MDDKNWHCDAIVADCAKIDFSAEWKLMQALRESVSSAAAIVMFDFCELGSSSSKTLAMGFMR